MADERVILTFHTTHAALRAEKTARQAGVPARLVPTPRDLSVDCTSALLLPSSCREHFLSLLQGQGIEVDGIHEGNW